MDINAEEEDEPAPEPYGKGTEFVAKKWSDEKDEKGDSKGYVDVQGTIVESHLRLDGTKKIEGRSVTKKSYTYTVQWKNEDGLDDGNGPGTG